MTADVIHSLWIMAAFAASAVSVAEAVIEARRVRTARRRLTALLPEAHQERRPGRRERWRAGGAADAIRDWVSAVGALLACLVLVGGPLGCALGLAAGYGARRWQRHRRATAGRSGKRAKNDAARQLPLAADLLTACLEAGAGPRKAAEAVGRSLGGPVGERLAQAAAELRLGGEPAAAWGRMGALPGAQRLARALERAGTTGAPAVEPVSRLAADCRAEQGRQADKRVERASVLATAPLGACYLPAFLLIGVAPVMLGLAGALAGGG
ncbi:type II secretion system F family protein [Streptomyces sp. ME19-01-6]|uniref:type II secretion system F family protein n=1 Tax=Streptomyces sp. ME19-01-6 TaxID=3028686 RepID=UPI0029A08FF4|nr:type II secretion system F family protein [Streptomyces sp. ME19-01-6]MDX3228363.1 type II secretion system F family protein [Streptomyces sp. ME19-01-6]